MLVVFIKNSDLNIIYEYKLNVTIVFVCDPLILQMTTKLTVEGDTVTSQILSRENTDWLMAGFLVLIHMQNTENLDNLIRI